MFQTLDEDLPPMSNEVRKLRSALMNAEGIHLIYNVPRSPTRATWFGPVDPFAGLCIAFLLYISNDLKKHGFNIAIGQTDKKYIIGWNSSLGWGFHSVAYWAGGPTGYHGAKVIRGRTFPKGYSYVYFYFKNSNTLHGWINDTHDLVADSVHLFPVSEAGKGITCSLFEGGVHLKCLEIHWVVWGSSHNRSGAPSSTLVDQLFPKPTGEIVDFKDADVFEMRTGTVVTVRTKYKKNASSSMTGVIIGIGCATCTNKNVTSKAFPECANANEVYTFRVSISEKGALIYKKEADSSYLGMPSYDVSHANCRAYLTFDNVKPVQIQVETRGQSWV